MYKVTRNHIVEELEITDGGKARVFSVDINVDEILSRYNQTQYKIAAAAEAAKKAKGPEDLQSAERNMGEAVLGLFELIFGADQAKEILDIYDGRSMEMLSDISPFIADVIMPKVHEAQERIQNRYAQVSKRGKK